MDKREFYKELMSEYSFDKEKIFANAKKGKMAGRKPFPIYIGMTAAAAAVIVAVSGVTIAINGDGSSGAVISPNSGISIMELTPEERVKKALAELEENGNSDEMRDVLVTFKNSLAPPQAQGVLASASDVTVKMLIMEDDSRISDKSDVEAVFNGGTAKIRGAVINCPGYQMTEIDSSDFVELVEILSADDLASLTTIEPVVPDDTSKTDGNSEVVGSIPTAPIVDIDDVPPVTEPDNSEVNDDTNSEPVQPIETTKPEQPTENPDKTVSKETERLPSGVSLPENAVAKSAYITDDIGAQKAFFLNDEVFFVRTDDAIRLYKWNGEIETLAVEQKAADVKTCWISENGSRMMVSAVEDGVRCKLYIIDATNCTINDMQVGEIVGNGEISQAAYNESLDIFSLNVLCEGTSDIYVANLSGYQPANVALIASGLERAALLAASGGTTYFSNVSAARTTIYRYSNGSVTEVVKLDGASTSAANTAFTHALIVCSSGSFVFDPAVETLVLIPDEGTVSFGVSANSLSCGGSYYTISNGKLNAVNSISVIAKIDYTRSFSDKYAAVVSNGSVRIIASPYSSKIMSEGVTFAKPVENASAEARQAVDCAIGVINAIADGKISQSGIDTAEKLAKTIDGCFTASAAAELRKICDISDNSLNYKSDSLSAITIADTVLVMENSENGTLFVKAGTFDGATAYTSVAVKLVSENGILKVDNVIC